MTDDNDEYDFSEMDTEAILTRMFRIKRKLEPELEAEYKALRDEALTRVDGAQPFLDEEGDKQVAFPVRPDKTVVNESVLGNYLAPMDELYERVFPRKLDRTALSELIAAGKFSDEEIDTFLEVRKGAGTPHIRFADPDGRA